MSIAVGHLGTLQGLSRPIRHHQVAQTGLRGRRAAVRAGRNRFPTPHREHPAAGAGSRRMTSLADATIAALRSNHDELAAVVRTLSDAQLTLPSGASEWTVAQVLSHLGSGAEITLAGLRAATGEAPPPAHDFNRSVWDRWDAMSPREQADGFLVSDASTVAGFEALSPEQRDSVQVSLGRRSELVPTPLSLAGFAGMRLNEAAQHSWDARVAIDPDAGLNATAANSLAAHFSGELSFMLGLISTADAIDTPATVTIGASAYGIALAPGSIALIRSPAGATATFTGPLEAALRLVSGRLRPEYTPAGPR
jgi:uncharacterized protein (TIGR03083 family)